MGHVYGWYAVEKFQKRDKEFVRTFCFVDGA